jgi:hypothetical protein
LSNYCAYLDVQLSEKTWYRVWYFGFTSFSSTLAGGIFLVFIIRDVLPLASKIVLNSLIVYLMKNYKKKHLGTAEKKKQLKQLSTIDIIEILSTI